MIYNPPNNKCLNQKIERIQYNVVLTITGANKATSQSRLHSELGLETFKFRRWFRKLCCFYKIKTTGVPQYLPDLIPQTNHLHHTSAAEDATTFYSRNYAFQYSFISVYNVKMEQT